MSLSIIIPTHNPDINFFRNVTLLTRQQPDWQIIVVNDNSSSDLTSLLPAAPNLTLLHNSPSGGAGRSRNYGLTKVEKDYIVFMDDDDFMDWDVVRSLMTMMDAAPTIDMAFSSYNILWDGIIQPPHEVDRIILENILQGQSFRVLNIDGNEKLLRFTNFPWNKVYRTEFIRRINLRFSETAVQNDVHAHWQSLLNATRILVTDSIQCTKDQNNTGNRISNLDDHRRLQAFIALAETYEQVKQSGLPQAEANFWAFYRDVIKWMLDIISPATMPLLFRKHIAFSGLVTPDISHRLEAEGVRLWELWDTNKMSDMLKLEDTPSAGMEDEEYNLNLLAEMSRLKHLSISLRQELDRRNFERDEANRMRDDAERARHDAECRREDAERDRERLEFELFRSREELMEMDRQLHSKAARWAFKIRSLYRSVVR